MNDRKPSWIAKYAAVPVVGVVVLLALRRESAPAPALKAEAPAADQASDRQSIRLAEAPATASAASPVSARKAPDGEFDEQELMLLLHSAQGNDPQLAAELAREGKRRFPNSPSAQECASILIHALAEQGLASEARGEAEDMVNRYPDSHWVREIEKFTGAHRRRNMRLDASGQLSYVDPPPPT